MHLQTQPHLQSKRINLDTKLIQVQIIFIKEPNDIRSQVFHTGVLSMIELFFKFNNQALQGKYCNMLRSEQLATSC